MEQVRVDKWLWAARFFKTRSAATDAVAGGRIDVNGVRAKPAKEVRADDILDIRIGEVRWTVVVSAVADKRGSAAVASTLYVETQESATRRDQHARERRYARPLGADLGRRPTKQDRRRLEALRRAQHNRAQQEGGP